MAQWLGQSLLSSLKNHHPSGVTFTCSIEKELVLKVFSWFRSCCETCEQTLAAYMCGESKKRGQTVQLYKLAK